MNDLDVHGVITDGSETSIGFDYCHAGDCCPAPEIPDGDVNDAFQEYVTNITKPTDHYWTFPNVKAETGGKQKQYLLLGFYEEYKQDFSGSIRK